MEDEKEKELVEGKTQSEEPKNSINFSETNSVESKENIENQIGTTCLKCGTPLKSDQQFCPKCGTERGATNNKICKNCGNVIEVGEKFCSKCGNKAQTDFQSDIVDNIQNTIKKNKFNKKTILIFSAFIFIIIAAIILCTNVLPKLMVSTTELLSEGKYEEAYQKAKSDEKEKILTENLIAYISNDASESLKDPSSFVLRNAWYDKSKQIIVLYINGNNSYGASVSGYWYYTYDTDENEYQLYTSLSSLENEKTYSWDDYSEKLEKILKNAAREIVKDIIADDSLEVSKDSIDNINNLFEKRILDDVELLSDNKNNPSTNSL